MRIALSTLVCFRLTLLLGLTISTLYSMCSLVVSVLDFPAVDPRSNPGSGSALLMSEKSQAVYHISSCHMLIDKALSSDKPNGHWFEADWLHRKNVMRSPVIERLMVRGSQVALKHDMEARTLVMELRGRAIKRWVPVVIWIAG